MKLKLTPSGWRQLATLLAGLALLYAAFEYGRSIAGYSALSAMTQRRTLASRVERLTAERDALQRRVAAGAVTRQVDEEAQSETQAMIGELQAELARQQQELEFHRGLVAEKFGTGTLRVQELGVRPDGGNRYTVLATLVQTATRDAIASGSLTIALNGTRRRALIQLKLRELTPDGQDRVSFSLRYFTTVEIPLVLPEGFQPAAIQLEYRSNRSGPDPVQQSFPWSAALVADGDAPLTPRGGGG
jgi:HAMP domain-containing protein